MAVQIGPTVGANGLKMTLPAWWSHRVGPFFNGDNRYVVLCNAYARSSWTSGSGSPSQLSFCRVFKSTDSGATWTEQDSANAKELPPTNNSNQSRTFGFASFAVVQDGTKLTIARLYWNYITNDPRVFELSQFDMASDIWLANLANQGDANAPSCERFVGIGSPVQPFFLALRPSDGHYFLQYKELDPAAPGTHRFAAGGNYDHSAYAEWIPGGGWQPAVRIFCESTVGQDHVPNGVTVGKDSRLHFIGNSIIGNAGTDSAPITVRFEHQSLESNGTLNPVEIVTTGEDSNQEFNIGVPATRTVSGEVELCIPYLAEKLPGNAGKLNVARGNSATAMTWSLQTIQTDAVKFGGAWQGYGTFAVGFVDEGAICVTVGDATDLYLYREVGGVWDSGEVLFTNNDKLEITTGIAYSETFIAAVFSNGTLSSNNHEDYAWYLETGTFVAPPVIIVEPLDVGCLYFAA